MVRISDEEIRAARSGSSEARAALMGKAAEIVGSMLLSRRRSTCDRPDLDQDDLRQAVLTQILVDLPCFRGNSGGSFVRWVETIVESRYRDALRRKVAHASFEGVLALLHQVPQHRALLDLASGPPEAASAEELTVMIRRAVAQLSPSSQQLIQLRFFDELSYDEIAVAMGFVTANAAECACRRVLVRLRVLLSNPAKRLDPRNRGFK